MQLLEIRKTTKIANQRPLIGLLLPPIMLVCAILACVGEQKLGILSPDASPTSFTLLGEVDHAWQAELIPGDEYEITLAAANSDHPVSQTTISINVIEGTTDIAGEINFPDETATTRIVAPESGSVKILVYSLIGERQENLGTFSIELKQLRN